MIDHGGAIVNILADFRNGFPGMAHTGAARAGVDNLTKTLAVEWASANVRINSVAPGVVLNRSAADHYQKNTGDPEFLQSAAQYIPAKRTASVEEVSSAVCFLLGEGSSYTSGITLRVDGGSSLRSNFYQLPDENDNPWPTYGSRAADL